MIYLVFLITVLVIAAAAWIVDQAAFLIHWKKVSPRIYRFNQAVNEFLISRFGLAEV